MLCWTPGSSQACSQLERNHLTLDGLPEVLRHVVAHVEVDRHTHQSLKLLFEVGDVEQRDFADHCWWDYGEQIEVTPFVIIASSGRAGDQGHNACVQGRQRKWPVEAIPGGIRLSRNGSDPRASIACGFRMTYILADGILRCQASTAQGRRSGGG